MIRILCTGDSHTWGEGATGTLGELDPKVIGGDLRLLSFKSGSYVNLLRREICKATDSYVQEWSAKEIAAMPNAGFCKPCAVIGNEAVVFSFRGSMLRMECRRGDERTVPEIVIDGVEHNTIELAPAQSENDYRMVHFFVEEGEHQISLRAKQGELLIYRAESYGGDVAVINSGVGSCPVGRYLEEFWKDRIAEAKPSLVVAEAHTINDWLTEETPEEYYDRLKALVEKLGSIGADVILLTVSPILEEQRRNGNVAEYNDYVEMSRKVALDTGAVLCDANAIMKICLEGLKEEEAAEMLYSDKWHPNDRGHAFYAEMIKQVVLPMCRKEK